MYDWGVTINEKHSYRDYGLYLTNVKQISPPEVKTTFVSVPARDGDLDLTETLAGRIVYGNRMITLEMGGKKKREEWVRFRDTVENDIHGKKVRLIFDDDPEYYWEGRAAIEDDYERGQEIGRFTITVNAQPYKLELRDAGADGCWLWDTFNFYTGIIRNYYRIQIDGTYDMEIIGREMPVIPAFDAEGDLTVTFKGTEYVLSAGTSKIYDIVITKGANLLSFNGKGVVSVHYRGGTL